MLHRHTATLVQQGLVRGTSAHLITTTCVPSDQRVEAGRVRGDVTTPEHGVNYLMVYCTALM